ncbi:PREDICTED: increased DNA methylation 3-like [Nelumbo nucifera]|nr:PREDICTED: increased DNA methylation 3-like [Nelumbo nucifera]
MHIQGVNNQSKLLAEASVNDQRFLLNFIMGTFLGPDVKTDIPRRSVFERVAEGLPQYSLNDLGSSFVSLSQVEKLYYYILKNAHPSAILELHSLHMYLKGKLPLPNSGLLEDARQFTCIFPLGLHEQTTYKAKHKIFKGIILIENPDTSYIKLVDLERFRHLTGIYDMKISREEIQLFCHGYNTDKEENEPNNLGYWDATTEEEFSNENAPGSAKHRNVRKKRYLNDLLQIPTRIQGQQPIEDVLVRPCNLGGPSIVSLAPTPNMKQWNSKIPMVLTGAAKEGRAGPPIGLVDIGISRDAYLFRVALPGVKRDPGHLSCEIEHDGKVHLRGMTMTGEKFILRHSRIFRMQTQNLCPPGPFTISFSLPGPVDPRLFLPDFRSDGILEAVVMKYRKLDA